MIAATLKMFGWLFSQIINRKKDLQYMIENDKLLNQLSTHEHPLCCSIPYQDRTGNLKRLTTSFAD